MNKGCSPSPAEFWTNNVKTYLISKRNWEGSFSFPANRTFLLWSISNQGALFSTKSQIFDNRLYPRPRERCLPKYTSLCLLYFLSILRRRGSKRAKYVVVGRRHKLMTWSVTAMRNPFCRQKRDAHRRLISIKMAVPLSAILSFLVLIPCHAELNSESYTQSWEARGTFY